MKQYFVTRICGIYLGWYFYDIKMASFFNEIINIMENDNSTAEFGVNYVINVHSFSEYVSKKQVGRGWLLENKKARIFMEETEANVYLDNIRIREPESLYYCVINPMIVHVLAMFNRLHLHGACMKISNTGIAVLGPRNSGKTTLSVLALENNYEVLTDDCFFLRKNMEAESFPRSLHIHPELGEKIGITNRLSECVPYMEGEEELNYSIEKYHPNQVINCQKVDIMLFTSVGTGYDWKISEIVDYSAKKRKIIQNNEYFSAKVFSRQLYTVVNRMANLPALEIELGEKIFDMPKKFFDEVLQIYNKQKSALLL